MTALIDADVGEGSRIRDCGLLIFPLRSVYLLLNSSTSFVWLARICACMESSRLSKEGGVGAWVGAKIAETWSSLLAVAISAESLRSVSTSCVERLVKALVMRSNASLVVLVMK